MDDVRAVGQAGLLKPSWAGRAWQADFGKETKRN
jgi:hypothetical protein